MKLIGNSLIMGSIEIASESITLGEKAGIDAELTVSLIKGNVTVYVPWDQTAKLCYTKTCSLIHRKQFTST